MAPALNEWETFYVIVGSSAAALTGLQFVVIALISEARNVGGGEEELQAFGTTTIVHFSAVLLIAAICSVPHQSTASLGICISLSAVTAILYLSIVFLKARRVTGYKPVLEDWIWHTILPFLSYAALLVAGITARAESSLYVIAACALLLLYIGIHNAWDTAIYISVMKRKEERQPPPSNEPPE